MGPVTALLTAERLDLDALERFHDQTTAQQRVVDAQGSFLVGAEDEARAELLVERTQREARHS